MTKIKRLGLEKEFFGSKMPTAFLNYIQIQKPDAGSTSNVKIEASINIKFSKPDYLQGKTAKEIIKSLNLYLYCFLTYHDWIKGHLEKGQFSLNYFFKEYATGLGLDYRGESFYKVAIADLLPDEPEEGDSYLTTLSTFDKDGDEIIQISNLIVTLGYTKRTTHPVNPGLDNVKNLMFFTFTGPQDTTLMAERSAFDDGGTSKEPYSSKLELMSSNSYFSDIAYAHVLQNDSVVSKYYQAYLTPEGVIYEKDILQSVNGKFFTTENVSFRSIVEQITNFINNYSLTRSSDPSLDANIASLEAIIGATENKVGILGELANYNSFFPEKNPATLSGQFYNEFVVIFSEIIEAVNNETELKTSILYDSLVTDLRLGGLLGSYSLPLDGYAVEEDDLQRGIPYNHSDGSLGTPSQSYLSDKWFLLSRRADVSDSITNLTTENIAAIYGLSTATVSESTATSMFAGSFTDEYGSGDQNTFMKIRNNLVRQYTERGFDMFSALELADEQMFSFLYGNDDFDPMEEELGDDAEPYRGRKMFPSLLYSGDSGITADDNSINYFGNPGDIKVINSGLFFFDYEKALRTQSKISKALDLTKLQQLFNFNVGYECFFVRKIELSRNEATLRRPQMGSDTLEEFLASYTGPMGLRSKMELFLKTPSPVGGTATAGSAELGIHEPINDYVRYSYSTRAPFVDVSDDGTPLVDRNTFLARRIKHLTPMGETGGSGQGSYLGVVNFDFPISPESSDGAFSSALMENYNLLDSYIDSGLPLNPADMNRVHNGYRMMAVKFRDVMDDDIAFVNTIDPSAGIFTAEEQTLMIESTNASGHSTTAYCMLVEVYDATQLAYKQFAEIIKKYYNDFNAYFATAIQVCSYNNLENEFNSFFKDAIEADYPDKPWEAAAYVAHALSELLFKPGSATNQEDMYSRITDTIISIGPVDGTLPALREFAHAFKTIMRYIIPAAADGSSSAEEDAIIGTLPIEGTTPYKEMKAAGPGDYSGLTSTTKLQFYNEKAIWEPIAGEIINDNLDLSDFAYEIPSEVHLLPTIPATSFTSISAGVVASDTPIDYVEFKAFDPDNVVDRLTSEVSEGLLGGAYVQETGGGRRTYTRIFNPRSTAKFITKSDDGDIGLRNNDDIRLGIDLFTDGTTEHFADSGDEFTGAIPNSQLLPLVQLFELTFLPLGRSDPFAKSIGILPFVGTSYSEKIDEFIEHDESLTFGETHDTTLLPSGFKYMDDETVNNFINVRVNRSDFLKGDPPAGYKKNIGGGLPGAGPAYKSMACYLIDKIFRYTTADNIIVPDESTTNRAGVTVRTGPIEAGAGTSQLRQYRKLRPLYKLVKDMRFALEGHSDGGLFEDGGAFNGIVGRPDETVLTSRPNLTGYPVDVSTASSAFGRETKSRYKNNYALSSILKSMRYEGGRVEYPLPPDTELWTSGAGGVTESAENLFYYLETIEYLSVGGYGWASGPVSTTFSRTISRDIERIHHMMVITGAYLLYSLEWNLRLYADPDDDTGTDGGPDPLSIMHMFNMDDPLGSEKFYKNPEQIGSWLDLGPTGLYDDGSLTGFGDL